MRDRNSKENGRQNKKKRNSLLQLNPLKIRYNTPEPKNQDL